MTSGGSSSGARSTGTSRTSWRRSTRGPATSSSAPRTGGITSSLWEARRRSGSPSTPAASSTATTGPAASPYPEGRRPSGGAELVDRGVPDGGHRATAVGEEQEIEGRELVPLALEEALHAPPHLQPLADAGGAEV